jgi:hypothetical protein
MQFVCYLGTYFCFCFPAPPGQSPLRSFDFVECLCICEAVANDTAPLWGRLCRVPGPHPRSGEADVLRLCFDIVEPPLLRHSRTAFALQMTPLRGRPVHYSASPLYRFSTLPLRGRMDGWTDGRK